ncbi:WecB/TagA/CpsF family glycosyltransferase [Shinella sumterensis]|nr:WecB/TagA/CpsF family glycosyltransferase [Shinella sumterensis]
MTTINASPETSMTPDRIRSADRQSPGSRKASVARVSRQGRIRGGNPLPTAIAPARRDILGLDICDLGWADALAFAGERATMPFGQSVIVFANADSANRMMRDPDYRAALSRQTVLPEDRGIDLAARLLHGQRFRARLAGTDFVPALLTYIAKPMRIALVGGHAATLKKAAEALSRHAPWHSILPIADDAFDRGQSDAIMERVGAVNADILLVSMDSPDQEKWIDRHVGPGHARLVLGVERLFETLSGEARHASPRRFGLGWLSLPAWGASRRRDTGTVGPLFLYHVLRYKFSGAKAESKRPEMAKAGSL